MSDSRLTTLDASFLEVESASAHMHVGWAALFAPPRGRPIPKLEELRLHVASRMGRAPRYRQKLAHTPLDVNDPVWVDDQDFDIDRHVFHATGGELSEITDRVMSTPLDRERPLWELWIADHLADGRLGVVGKAHHAMADGLAAVELSTLMLDPTPQPPQPEPDGWRPARRPSRMGLLVDGLADRAAKALDVASWPLGLVRHPRRIAALPADGMRGALALSDALRPAASDTGLNEPISGRRHLARAHRPLGDFQRVKRRFRTTINDVVLAVATGGLRHFMEHRGETPVPLKTMVPVSVRPEHGSGEFGNQISFVFIDLPCDEPDPLRRLTAIQRQMGDRKRSGEPEAADNALKVFGYAPRTLQKVLTHLLASPRTFNLVVSNIPGPREPVYMLGCELEEVYPVVPLADRHALSIGLTTISNEAFFGVYTDTDSLPDADLLAAFLDESLDELLALDGHR